VGFAAQLKLYEKMKCCLVGESDAHKFYAKFLLDDGTWDAKQFFESITCEDFILL